MQSHVPDQNQRSGYKLRLSTPYKNLMGSRLKGIIHLAFRYKAIRKGTFKLSFGYEIEYGYDFRISNQWRFQSPRSSCLFSWYCEARKQELKSRSRYRCRSTRTQMWSHLISTATIKHCSTFLFMCHQHFLDFNDLSTSSNFQTSVVKPKAK